MNNDEPMYHFAGEINPTCCGAPMEPVAQEVENYEGATVWTMYWRCRECHKINDHLVVPAVWATAYCLATNPLLQAILPKHKEQDG